MSNVQEKFLINNLVGDYQKLTQDIITYENDLESRDRKWREIGGIKNPNFEEDRKRTFISNKITDLREQRNRIWNFLTIQFNANTKIRDSNFKQIQKLNEDISRVNNQIITKQNEISDSQGHLGKKVREHQILVYNNSRDKEMIYLYSIGLVCLIICLAIMVIVLVRNLELKIMYFGVAIILGIYLLYLLKVIYVDNVNRSQRFMDEIDFNKPDKKFIAMNQANAANNQNGCGGGSSLPEFSPYAPSDAAIQKIRRTVVLNDDTCLQDSTTNP